jgi:hypothetical protein
VGESVINFLVYGPGGNIASILGVVISSIGFFLTIQNVLKSKTAAQAAEQAVQRVREDVHRINVVKELSEAISTMREIKRLHRQSSSLDTLLDRYSELRAALVNIRTASQDLSTQHKTYLQNAIVHFSEMEKHVETALTTTKQESLNIPKLNEIVSKQMDNLREILVQIQSDIGA